MKNRLTLFLLALLMLAAKPAAYANEPDSAYLFAYATAKNQNHNGLHFAWSIDRKNWFPIGPEFAFVKSDYSSWGSEKRMLAPVLLQDKSGNWHAVWSLNERDGAFAYAFSENLVDWKPQDYPIMSENQNCLQLLLTDHNGEYSISWASTHNDHTHYYATTTRDFKTFSPTKQVALSDRKEQREEAVVSGQPETGTIHRVAWKVIDGLEKKVVWANYRAQLFAEKTAEDPQRFAGLESVEASLNINGNDKKEISDLLMGIFFEDINYAADGGIYAELIQNRGFEYSSTDNREWNAKSFWKTLGEGTGFEIATDQPIHENNPHHAVLTVDGKQGGIFNEGFGGIVLKDKEKYDLTLFARLPEGKGGKLLVRLTDEAGKVYGETTISGLSKKWKKQKKVITVKGDVAHARLEIIPQTEGKYALDMVSLFPQKSFKNRKNGLRADLAQTLADMNPRFVRFPGGCVAHGNGIENIYHWKNTIGELEARKPQRNIWRYHQSAGLGYFEYFQFCEDLGAEPVPIVAAGVPCQNSAKHNHAIGGQQGGIPICEMDNYIQDILDLIEWANGDPKTNKWAKLRAEAGHPKPFNLKYIGVGNEDLISDVFEERFTMIFNAVKEKYPEIQVIGTAGPFSEGSDYDYGWKLGTKLGVPLLDEHYYQPPGWYIYNQEYYDRYDRSKPKVYLGEYAAHLPGRPNNVETALAEALHLISCERNGDVVVMTSYAPLLAKQGFTQWNPDLIYFDNLEVKPTVGYYVQQLFGQNAGTEYIASSLNMKSDNEKVRKRVACSVVRDPKSDKLIIKLVNLLPVEVKTSINREEMGLTASEAVKTVLSGEPGDRAARPVETKVPVSDLETLILPAYSFTVIAIPAE